MRISFGYICQFSNLTALWYPPYSASPISSRSPQPLPFIQRNVEEVFSQPLHDSSVLHRILTLELCYLAPQ
jgi:hypothetical protein